MQNNTAKQQDSKRLGPAIIPGELTRDKGVGAGQAVSIGGAMPKADAKEKPKKDPNAPKKPSGPFIFYCKAKRECVKQQRPGIGVAEMGKTLGAMWSEESEENKRPFYDLAEGDKQRYAREIAQYNKALLH